MTFSFYKALKEKVLLLYQFFNYFHFFTFFNVVLLTARSFCAIISIEDLYTYQQNIL